MGMKMTWIGQAGFIVRSDTGSYAVDPFCGPAGPGGKRLYETSVPKNGYHVDFAISSHDHWDHFDVVSYRDYVIPKAIVGPGSCMNMLAASELKGKVEGVELNVGNSIARSGFKVTAVFAQHDRDSIGAVVEHDGTSVYFSGDTLFDLRLLRTRHFKPDIVCICINGKLGNMNFFEAAAYCDVLAPKVAIPTHYDTIEHNTEDPHSFRDALSRMNKDIKCFIPERGVEYDLQTILK